MKYKLINTKTKEETICDKVTIDGFDYYVSDGEKLPDAFIYDTKQNKILRHSGTYGHLEYIDKNCKKVIATNNPNIDIPQVVDEVEIKVDEILNKELPNFTPYHRRSFFLGYNKSQETHPFSEEDMIEFLNYYQKTCLLAFNGSGQNHGKTTKELLQLWKEQKPKIVYYE